MNSLFENVEFEDFTHYAVAVPEWFVREMRLLVNAWDLRSLTNGRLEAINVNTEHPLVQLTGAVLQAGGQSMPSLAGILPAISVIEGDEGEEFTTVGQGLRPYQEITADFLQQFKPGGELADYEKRIQEGLMSDQTVQRIESFIQDQGGPVLAMVNQYFMRETVSVSVWTTTPQEVFLLTRLVRSALFRLRPKLAKLHAVDIQIRASRGLVNFNFGRVLFGTEFTVTFLNQFSDFRVFNTRNRKVLDVCVDAFYTGAGSGDDPVSAEKYTTEVEQ